MTSLAVLPLLNIDADPAQEYLADGVTESLIRQLSSTPGLRVLARASVFSFKGEVVDPVAAGRQLGVDALLAGTIGVRGERIDLRLDLTDCHSGIRTWRERFELDVDDLPVVEAKVSDSVSGRLAVAAEPPRRRPSRTHPQAYRLYLRGRYLWNQRNEASLDRAREFFEQALDLDPKFALAWTGIADTWNVQPFWGIRPPKQAFPHARKAVDSALKLDPDLPEALVALGYTQFYFDWDWPAAEGSFKRALALAPNLAVAHHRLGVARALVGDHEGGLAAMNRAMELDPLSLIIQADLGLVHLLAGQPEMTETQCRGALELAPDFAPAHYYLGLALDRLGDTEAAVEAFLRAEGLAGGAGWALAAAGHSWAVSGRSGEARRVLQRLEAFRETYYVPEYAVAVVHVGLGEMDEALDWLERGMEQRCERMVWLFHDPHMESLAENSRLARFRAELPHA